MFFVESLYTLWSVMPAIYICQRPHFVFCGPLTAISVLTSFPQINSSGSFSRNYTRDEREAAGMRIKHLQVRGRGSLPENGGLSSTGLGAELLLQVKEFKYLLGLFTSEGEMEWEMDRCIGAVVSSIVGEGAEP